MASFEELVNIRKKHYGPNTSLHFDPKPLHIVRGDGVQLIDNHGNVYLDCVNNVAMLGHAHPKVTHAISTQLAVLNTNSRYLHQGLVDYTKELLATMPSALEVLYMVCSGSEANDLALRIAKTARPGAEHVVVMGGAYHGHTGTLISCSPYKFWGTGGQGRQPNVHVIPCPDPYRGEYLDGRAAAQAAVAQAHAEGGKVAAFIAESILSCGGQIIMPPGYLQGVYDVMRQEGAVCIADEVQCGFGRVGQAFWAFETQHVVPDIVTLGKPMGNGYPVAGLVTTRALADAFAGTGMEYFNTYGGSTAQAAAALAVLRCLKEEHRQTHAHKVGGYLLQQLREVQAEHPQLIGDVRGMGLMVGLDCIRNPHTKQHAPKTAKWIKERCKDHGVLLSTDGPYDNVLKMKPPLVFDVQHVDQVVSTLRHVLSQELTQEVQVMLNKSEDEAWASVFGPRMALYRGNERDLGLATPASLPAVVRPLSGGVTISEVVDEGLMSNTQPKPRVEVPVSSRAVYMTPASSVAAAASASPRSRM